MFRNTKIQRGIAAIVLTTFTSLSLYPLTAAAQAREAVEKAGLLPKQKDEGFIGNAKRYIEKLAGDNKNASQSSDEQLGQLLNEIHEQLKAVTPDTALPKEAQRGKGHRAPLSDNEIDDRVKSIRTKTAKIKNIYADIDQSFKDTEKHLKDAKLPQVILDRHHAAVTLYESRKTEFGRLISKIEDSDDKNNKTDRKVALSDLGSFMAKNPNSKPHQYTDPNKLPFNVPDGKVRAPFETKEQFQASLFPPKYDKVMLAGAIPDGLQLAQASLPQVPVPADTAETEDVQITQAIKDQATALNNNPVNIYNWVRNNIQFIPSYGSIQGSDMTLQNRRGNAFDTASLLIAMMRAAGIPARYVYSTIEVPADKLMNWVGDVTKVEAAQSLLGQGGIPNIGIMSGGVIKTIRMEHVSVEVYVDILTRGEINRAPQKLWFPVDASFKQYKFTKGMDVKGNVPLDAQTLITQATQYATVNETDGWAQDLNQANLQSQLAAYQAQVQTYISSQNAGATIGDVLGTQTIVPENFSMLAGTLPYKTVATANTFQSLPDNLRLRISFNLYTSAIDKSNQAPAFSQTIGLSRIGSKRIAVTYVPATDADRQLLKQYSDSQATILPSYLVQQKAQLRLDNTVLAEYVAQQMGQEEYWTYTLLTPGGNPIEEDFKAESSVGDEIVFGINGNGITPAQVDSRYHAVDPNSSLENLNHLALGYWARADMSDDMLARQSRHVTYR